MIPISFLVSCLPYCKAGEGKKVFSMRPKSDANGVCATICSTFRNFYSTILARPSALFVNASHSNYEFYILCGSDYKRLFLGLKARNVIAQAVANAVSEGLGKDPLVPSPVSGGNLFFSSPSDAIALQTDVSGLHHVRGISPCHQRLPKILRFHSCVKLVF